VIASLHGRLAALAGDRAVVDVGGIGFAVHVPASTAAALGAIGHEVTLHTHLRVREDGVALFGFATGEELALFETLIGVSGLGPKLALAMLSTMSAPHLAIAIAAGNAEMLTVVPGVGKKTASRIILELKDKISAGLELAPAFEPGGEEAEVLAALTSLGYSVSEASRAIAALPPEKMSLEEKVRLALQYFGGKR